MAVSFIGASSRVIVNYSEQPRFSLRHLLTVVVLSTAGISSASSAGAAIPFTPTRPATWAKAADDKAKAGETTGSDEAKEPGERVSPGSKRQCGRASWYMHGSRTANGERFVPAGLTAAHRSMPFGTRIRVSDRSGTRSVTVRINDRGPFVHGRVLDLSKGAAARLGMIGRGVGEICYVVLE